MVQKLTNDMYLDLRRYLETVESSILYCFRCTDDHQDSR